MGGTFERGEANEESGGKVNNKKKDGSIELQLVCVCVFSFLLHLLANIGSSNPGASAQTKAVFLFLLYTPARKRKKYSAHP